ncbi:hypothetical protein WH47_11973 [Habropoda laboriosa]|uniref:Uncharacterized protein n=1 Tax=Habropoda laboriosa TaxID=597456 RepID=A0A0L7R7U2_9HYME|nr:hypothetical protein WH47_11973 [Habropoda laboriosa]
MNKYTQAISFANSYFALVDGLVSGLESQLSEDVVLHWFGRTVRGRRNVCAFMETHKVNSRHMFTRIVPTTGISYEKKHSNRGIPKMADYLCRKEIRSRRDRNNQELLEIDNNTDNEQTFFRETETSLTCPDVMRDFNQNEIEVKDMNVTVDDAFYDLNEGDLSNLFKLEITSTNIEEIEQSINRIKLEEEMTPTITAIKRECGEGDGPDNVETSAVKYVEADDAWNAYFSATTNVHTWRRPCKLQIAYTTSTERPHLVSPCESRKVAAQFEQPKARLPSLEEINEISNRLIPNTNYFGGYLYHVDLLKELRTDIGTNLIARSNLNERIVLEKPCVCLDDSNGKNKKRFIFNYQIRLIIYEGRNERNANLPQEF